MKLFYLANIRLPTEKAHGIQMMQTINAFANLEFRISNLESISNDKISKNIEIEFVVPRRLNPIKEDPFGYYGVNKNFKITYLPVLDLVKWGRVGFWIESLIFSKVAAIYLFFKKSDVIYGRDELPLWILSFFHKNIFWEAHQGQINFAASRLLKKSSGVVVISNGLKNFYVERRVPAEKIFVAHDAVDFNAFDINLSKKECRRALHLPQDPEGKPSASYGAGKKIVLYSGHLYKWKGFDVLLGTARILSDVFFVFVGGTEQDIESIKYQVSSIKLNNVLIAGLRPHSEIPLWLKAADILVLPNSAKTEISRSFTSPLKLFEYMVSNTPIVASDLPSVREVVSENDVLFFKSDDPRDLAKKIEHAFEHEDEMRTKAESAKQKVQNHTWAKRAEVILNFISQKKTPREKHDFLPAFFAGLGIALLALPVLNNLSVLDFLFSVGEIRVYFLIALWIVFVSLGAVFGIYLARLLGRRWPIILQLARYGLIGWLNTFVYAGVFNLLIWFTGIARGFTADFLVFISFVVAVTNSFFWNKHWVFEHSDSGHAKTEYAKFFAVTGFTALLNIFVFHLVVNTIGSPEGLDEKIWANVSILIQIPISFLGNFFGYKIFVFKKKMLS